MTLLTVPLLAGGTLGGRLDCCLNPSQPPWPPVVKSSTRGFPPVRIRIDENLCLLGKSHPVNLTDLSITDSVALLLLRILDLPGLVALHPAQSQRGRTFRKRGSREPAEGHQQVSFQAITPAQPLMLR